MKKLILSLSIVVIIIDLWSKAFVANSMVLGESITVIPNFFWIHYVVNEGVGWSMFSGYPQVFALIGIVVAVVLVYYYFKVESKLEMIAIALIIGGTLGNVYDRLVLGHVRDMLSFNIFGYMFPVFNVADMALTCGVGLLIIQYVFVEREYGKN